MYINESYNFLSIKTKSFNLFLCCNLLIKVVQSLNNMYLYCRSKFKVSIQIN